MADPRQAELRRLLLLEPELKRQRKKLKVASEKDVTAQHGSDKANARHKTTADYRKVNTEYMALLERKVRASARTHSDGLTRRSRRRSRRSWPPARAPPRRRVAGRGVPILWLNALLLTRLTRPSGAASAGHPQRGRAASGGARRAPAGKGARSSGGVSGASS